MKTGVLTKITYTKGPNDVTTRDIIPINIPSPNMYAIDTSNLPETEVVKLLNAIEEYNNLQKTITNASATANFVAFLETRNETSNEKIDPKTIQYRNFAMSKLQEVLTK